MLRRLKFFSIGLFIGILFVSFGPDNRFQKTFIAYLDYFNPDKRVIRQLLIADSLVFPSEFMYDYHNLNISSDSMPFRGSWINHDLSDKDSYPQVFVLENYNLKEESIRFKFNFYDNEKKKDSSGPLLRYTKSELVLYQKEVNISERSFESYYLLLGMFFLVMVPVSLLVRRLVLKRRNN